MSLRAQAEADLAFTLEDTSGFGWAISVTDPDGITKDLVGSSGDIGTTIDPDTGQAVSGREAHVVLRISSLVSNGLGIPKGIASSTSKPWLVTFNDIGGTAHTFKVKSTEPDQSLGVVKCMLEAYQA